MRRLRSHSFFKYLVLLFLVMYRVGVFSNMFFIPPYTQTISRATSGCINIIKSIRSQGSYQAANFMQIIDKSVVDGNLLEKINFMPVCVLLFFVGLAFIATKSVFYFRPVVSYYHSRYSYLSLRMLRI